MEFCTPPVRAVDRTRTTPQPILLLTVTRITFHFLLVIASRSMPCLNYSFGGILGNKSNADRAIRLPFLENNSTTRPSPKHSKTSLTRHAHEPRALHVRPYPPTRSLFTFATHYSPTVTPTCAFNTLVTVNECSVFANPNNFTLLIPILLLAESQPPGCQPRCPPILP